MKGAVLAPTAESFGELWRDYWRTRWHVPLPWNRERLSCFLSPSEGRSLTAGSHQDALVRDFPSMRRPILGVITQEGGARSSQAGLLEFAEDGHLLTVAPTRSGKGACQIIPNLLTYGGSCLVIDIKGENCAITAEHRAAMFPGAHIVTFAPFDDVTDTYNPFDYIRVEPDGSPNSYTFDDVRLLSEMLVPARPRQEFWDLEARNLVTTLLFFVATAYRPGHPNRCMQRVVQLLFPSHFIPPGDGAPRESAFDESLNLMGVMASRADNAVLISLLNTFLDHDEKVRAGILSTCRATMNIWLSERLLRATARSSFQFSDLKASMCRPLGEDPAPTTIYLIIPPEYLRDYSPVLRMLVGLAAIELTRPGAWSQRPGWREHPPCPVLFLLDEFPALGFMPPIANGVAYLAGYGVQLWTFVQSIGQLKDLYGANWSTFMSNAGAACYFGVSDPDLADLLARQLGNTEEYEHRYFTSSTSDQISDGRSSSYSFAMGQSGDSRSDGTNTGTSSTTSTTENVRFNREPVASAADIRAMPPELQLVMMRNRRAALASLLPYHRCELFADLYGSWGAAR